MSHKSNLLPKILPQYSLQLGWLVLDTDEPLQSYHTPSFPYPPDVKVTVRDVSYTSSTEKSSNFLLSLGLILNSRYQKNNGVSFDVNAAEASLYTLPNSEGWFEQICASAHTREWLGQKIKRTGPLQLRVYLIVGLHVLHDVEIVARQTGGAGARASDNTKAPMASMVIAGTRKGSHIDPAVSSAFGNIREMRQSFRTDNLIYAVQYRQLKFNWLPRKNLDKSYLSQKTCWKVMVTGRSEEVGFGAGKSSNQGDDPEEEAEGRGPAEEHRNSSHSRP